MKTFKVELIRPKGHNALWIVRGLPPPPESLHPEPEWMLEYYAAIGVSHTNDTILRVDHGTPKRYGLLAKYWLSTARSTTR